MYSKIKRNKQTFADGSYIEQTWAIKVATQHARKNSIDDKPAEVWYNKLGIKTKEVYYKDNNMHRDNDNPAIISYDNKGNITMEAWLKHGVSNRDDKPSTLYYDKRGNLIKWSWCRDRQNITKKARKWAKLNNIKDILTLDAMQLQLFKLQVLY